MQREVCPDVYQSSIDDPCYTASPGSEAVQGKHAYVPSLSPGPRNILLAIYIVIYNYILKL